MKKLLIILCVLVTASRKGKQVLSIQRNTIKYVSFKEEVPNLIKDFDKKEE